MTEPTPPNQATSLFTKSVAGLAVAVGGLVLLGWLLDSALLKSIWPGWVSMKANTALAFILSGAVLWRGRADWLSGACAAAIALIGLATLSQYLLGRNFGIDQLLFAEPPGTVATSHPGRMAPLSAFAFLLLGCALLAAQARRWRPTPYLALAVSLVGALSLSGYLFGATELTGVAGYTKMAAHTAALFILLGLGVLAAHPELQPTRLLSSRGVAGTMARRMLPMAIVIPFIVGALRTLGQRAGLYGTEFGITLMVLGSALLLLIVVYRSVQQLDRLDMERCRAEAELKQNEARLQQILDILPVGVWLADAGGQLQYHNVAGKALWAGANLVGIEQYGQYQGWWLHNGQPIAAEEWAMARAIRNEETSLGEEIEIQCFDGTRKIILNSAMPLRDPQGNLTGAIAVNQDITGLKHAEQAQQALTAQLHDSLEDIARKNVLLEESSRMKSEFLANMSHELRTPLNAIIGFSEVLKDGLLGELPKQQREYVAEIFDSGEHLLSLINDILDLSKIEAGKLELEQEPLDLEALLAGSLAVVREKAAAHKIGLSLQWESPLGPLRGDARKLKQIVYNLVSNAVKFTPDGGQVALHVQLVDRQRAGGAIPGEGDGRRLALPESDAHEFVEISVSDTGIGIAPADLQRLFQPFVQIDSSLSRQFEGTGLGLAMVQRLAELHGGAVAVASAPGSGSCFTVWLPYRPASPDSPPAAAGAAVAPLPLPLPQPAPTAARALVIEDDANATELMRLYLEDEGFTVDCARSAEEGLRLAQALPAVIVLDILLPGMDGWDCLARLKETPALAHAPVVIVSMVADRSKGQALGAAAVLQKPIGRDELFATLRKLGVQPQIAGPLRVLVVDDDPNAVELTACILADSGCKVLRAYSGREGVDLARQALPDLLVLDLMMPEINGFDVVSILRTTPATARIPILVLTAKMLTANDRALLDGRVQSILSKTDFGREAFLNEVRRALAAPQAPARQEAD